MCQHADEGDKFGKPQRGEQKNAAKVRLFHAQGRDVQHAEQKKSRRIDRCAVQAEILRGKIKKRRRKGGGRDRHAEVAAAVFRGFSLPLFLCHVEVGEANERAERKKRHGGHEPEVLAARAPADGGGQHTEADEVIERVDLNAEALFRVCAVCLGAGDVPVKGIEQPREHQVEHGGKRCVLRGGINAGKPQQQREIGCDDSVVVNSDHIKRPIFFGIQSYDTR